MVRIDSELRRAGRRSGVFDGEVDVVIDHVGGDRDPAVFGQVVADGVVDQVLGEPFQEYWVACDRGGLQVGADVDVAVLRGALGFRGDVPCDVGEVDRGGAVIMFPSFWQSIDGGWSYEVILLAEATLFFSLSLVLRRRGLLTASLIGLVLVAGRVLFDAINALPNWLVALFVGMALLSVGLGILIGRDRWSRWQEAVLSWWGETDHVPQGSEARLGRG